MRGLKKIFFTFDRKSAISPAGHAIIQAQLIQLAFREKAAAHIFIPNPVLRIAFAVRAFLLFPGTRKLFVDFYRRMG
jgi:hypothetical protein